MKKAEILLINAPCYNMYDNRKLQPLGISYICASLRSNGFSCDILDANLLNLDIDQIVYRINAGKYKIVGFYLLEDTFKNAVCIAQRIKKDGVPLVIAGGVFVTVAYEFIAAHTNVFDILVRGDGEEVVVRIVEKYLNNGLSALRKQSDFRNVYDVLYTSEQKRIDVNASCFPVRDCSDKYSCSIIDNIKLINIPILSSRGCPYGCTFCTVPNLGYSWTPRRVHDVASEIQKVVEMFGTSVLIIFTDDNFFVDPDRAIRILETANEYCGTILKYTFATRADQLVRAGIDCLYRIKINGCVSVELGVENGSNNVLKRFNKGLSVDTNSKALSLLRMIGLVPSIDYIMFDPFITLNELTENINFLKTERLWGYYPPRIYNRVFPYLGTKAYALYNEINNFETEYFVNNDVSVVYNVVSSFRKKFQNKIDFVLSKDDKYISELSVKDNLYLKLIPYTIFEKAVRSSKRKERFCFDDTYLETVLNKYISD